MFFCHVFLLKENNQQCVCLHGRKGSETTGMYKLLPVDRCGNPKNLGNHTKEELEKGFDPYC